MTLAQRATRELMRVVHRRDRNTRGLAKVVSAMAYLLGGGEGFEYLGNAKQALLEERRQLNAALLDELDKQKYGKGL